MDVYVVTSGDEEYQRQEFCDAYYTEQGAINAVELMVARHEESFQDEQPADSPFPARLRIPRPRGGPIWTVERPPGSGGAIIRWTSSWGQHYDVLKIRLKGSPLGALAQQAE